MTDASDIREAIHVRTSIMGPCPLCIAGDEQDDPTRYDDDYLENRVNHLLGSHGCRLLHIGQESSTDGGGNPWQMTVALIGVPHGHPTEPWSERVASVKGTPNPMLEAFAALSPEERRELLKKSPEAPAE